MYVLGVQSILKRQTVTRARNVVSLCKEQINNICSNLNTQQFSEKKGKAGTFESINFFSNAKTFYHRQINRTWSSYTNAIKQFGSSTNWLFLSDLPCRKTCTRSSYLSRLEFPESSLKASQSLALFEIHFHSDEGNGKCNPKLISLQFRWFSICFSGRLSRSAHSSTRNDRTAALEHFWNMNMKKSYKEHAYNHLKLWYNVYGNVSLQYSRAFLKKIFFFSFCNSSSPVSIVRILFWMKTSVTPSEWMHK